MTPNPHYSIGDIVYFKTDPDQDERFITGINIREAGIMYEVSNYNGSNWVYSFEISLEKDVVKHLKNDN